MRLTALFLSAVLAACASATHHDLPDSLKDPAPMTTKGATLTVLGLSCPNCATNIDLSLKALPNVQEVYVNLDTGLVDVAFRDADPRPSPLQLATAVRNSGFTVVAVQGR
ncbi:MAG: Heavy-metal-associated domain [Planctomycetota bacterium]|jgi:copper chaperone CopZ